MPGRCVRGHAEEHVSYETGHCSGQGSVPGATSLVLGPGADDSPEALQALGQLHRLSAAAAVLLLSNLPVFGFDVQEVGLRGSSPAPVLPLLQRFWPGLYQRRSSDTPSLQAWIAILADRVCQSGADAAAADTLLFRLTPVSVVRSMVGKAVEEAASPSCAAASAARLALLLACKVPGRVCVAARREGPEAGNAWQPAQLRRAA